MLRAAGAIAAVVVSLVWLLPVAFVLAASFKPDAAVLSEAGGLRALWPGEPSLSNYRDVLDRVFATMPMRKVATADDVASAIVFLTSHRLAGHITGAIVPVAGGMEGRVLH